ncbi:DNA-binding response regulator [Shewanella sairae]|uniref:DNA-binding response regulator n=1 Tax=Shewanella sairae TaxID=190310 RepID=A0ABQ4PKY7_9GAMM|nr:response regulator transcription factor [Shewanella sairae]MCL1128931.1 response regulator transcription factor [Shewanella sairae]GIU48640.1 DNA-binding response regulator [Shewanella sairae]
MNGSPTSNEHQITKRILLVEDEQDLAKLVMLNLKSMNHHVVHCTSLQQAKHHLANAQVDLILMDRMLPDGDAITLCQQFRHAGNQLPCMMLSTKGEEADIVLGLESGADDYLVKPFSLLELNARVKALIRRSKLAEKQDHAIKFEGITIDCNTREVIAFNEVLELTAREFDLLLYLAQHPKQVFSRMQLLEAVWGYSYSGYEHTVNSHVNRLRSKLSRNVRTSKLVKTVWGVGYKFTPPAASM